MKKQLTINASRRLFTILTLSVIGFFYAYARELQGFTGLETSELQSDLWTLCGRAELTEDFSTTYSYNEVGALKSLTRNGIVMMMPGLQGKKIERFGQLDNLSYLWDGVLLVRTLTASDGTEFYGRAGVATDWRGTLGWNDAGLLVCDPSRGIASIFYNWFSKPVSVKFEDGSEVTYTYSSSGVLMDMKHTAPSSSGISYNRLKGSRTYVGNFVFRNDTISMINFGEGYFDRTGNPFYRHTDWQGSVTMVTDRYGQIVQHTGYYPYGEPWREPEGQPYLFAGKERMRDNGCAEYDFSARRYNSALVLWSTPDPRALDYGHLSPYTFCAGNPIKYVDPKDSESTSPSFCPECESSTVNQSDKEFEQHCKND
ncbi:MAG: hypothetical protein K2M19_05020 [Muribaculaceae bacterium]|nr:hypothetical protein [Muribaculaceae bacterium]